MIQKHYLSFFGSLVIVRIATHNRPNRFRVAVVNDYGHNLDDDAALERAAARHAECDKARRARASVSPTV